LNQNKDLNKNAPFAKNPGQKDSQKEYGSAQEKHVARNLLQTHII